MEMKQYEYDHRSFPNDGKLAQHLNAYGRDGWQVVSADYKPFTDKYNVLMMRVLPSQEQQLLTEVEKR
jgi:hypothetical protein